jgi:hypothetical protein
MPRNSLFSTYSQPENRVTASMVAVFERIGLDTLEQLLVRASGESSLAFVSFSNQVTGPASVPDAAISSSFRYLVEVKVVRNTLRPDQLHGHLSVLDGSYSNERLFAITPDVLEPSCIAEIADDRLLWFSFASLAQASDQLLLDPQFPLAEQERFLLRELAAFFEEEGLLSADDTVIVAAQKAYGEYLRTGAYICQPGRAFRPDAEWMGFYAQRMIQPEIGRIRGRFPQVPFTTDEIDRLTALGDEQSMELASLISISLEGAHRQAGLDYQIILLSPTTSEDTIHLAQPIANAAIDRNGQPTAWVQGQRYTRLALLQEARTTLDLIRQP